MTLPSIKESRKLLIPFLNNTQFNNNITTNDKNWEIVDPDKDVWQKISKNIYCMNLECPKFNNIKGYIYYNIKQQKIIDIIIDEI